MKISKYESMLIDQLATHFIKEEFDIYEHKLNVLTEESRDPLNDDNLTVRDRDSLEHLIQQRIIEAV